MPRVLIAGCGYVGQATAELFHAAGWEVEGWTASARICAELCRASRIQFARSIFAQRSGARRYRCVDFDVVIHCASSRGGEAEDYRRIYLEGAGTFSAVFRTLDFFLRAARVFTRRLDGSWVDEISAGRTDARNRQDSCAKQKSIVLAHGGIVARLAGIYGPGRSFFCENFSRVKRSIDRESDRFINQAHRDDIASALFAAEFSDLRTESESSTWWTTSRFWRSECLQVACRTNLHRPLPPQGRVSRASETRRQ